MNSRDNHVLSYSKLINKTLSTDTNTDPSHINPRWLLLILISMTSFNDSITNSLLPSLQTNIISILNLTTDQFQDLQQTTFGFLALTPLLIGFAIDFSDPDSSYKFFAGLLAVGQAFQALGGGTQCWLLIFIGKIFLTMAIGALTVIKAVILTRSFTGKELSLALATSFAATQAGALIGNYLGQGIFKWCQNLYVPLLLGIFFAVISWVTVIFILRVNRRTDRQGPGDRDSNKRSLGALVRGLRILKAQYIMVVLGIAGFTGAFYGFSYNPQETLTGRFGLSDSQAIFTANISMLVFPAIIAPLTGYFIDQIGMRLRVLGISFISLALCASVWVGLPGNTANFIIILLCLLVGILYGVFQGILWPCVALTTDERMTGIGYGIAYSFVNFLLWVWFQSSLVSGPERLVNNIIVIITAIVGIGLVYWLYKVDEREDQGKLEKPGTGVFDDQYYKSPIPIYV